MIQFPRFNGRFRFFGGVAALVPQFLQHLFDGWSKVHSPADSKMTTEWTAIPHARSRETTLPIVRDNYRINKFTSCWNAYNISTSAKWYRDTVVYHRASYRPLPVTHCTVYVVSSDAFGSYPLFLYGAYRASFENRWHFKETRTPANRERTCSFCGRCQSRDHCWRGNFSNQSMLIVVKRQIRGARQLDRLQASCLKVQK